ncbi:helix-turn-helix domain-containing protein [Lacticaseibacillus thailandensis]|uniref:Xre-like DNA-binding protein n=1 Tax=Lacticaseibacillus thailandensis DSM 22698 = JCM 13996 TaxID=1423810 RepID=A0A0R2C7L1_9LACO|nr:helix-turn-helix domain-containing protein [Lacticaseibacillus thailandensis]KRM87757.1 Xre-like DNA-binding protein [Lacticaseibacillus thailandensis DSM 22698 = JCM 13996]
MDEIGQKLREARLEKGYTLDDLQQITKIQKRYLIAIEEGHFDALPGDFYVRAFIKQYAQVVGLDAEALMEQYQQDIPEVKPENVVPNPEDSPTRTANKPQSRGARLRRFLPQIIIALVAVVIIAVVYGSTIISQRSNDSTSDIPVSKSSTKDDSDSIASSKKSSRKQASRKRSAQSSSKQTTSSSSSKTVAKGSSKQRATSSGSKFKISKPSISGSTQNFTLSHFPKSGNKVVLKASSGSAWVSVSVAGTTTWQGTLDSGKSHTVRLASGTTSFTVSTGNAPATTVKINGKKAAIKSSTSVVQTLTFAPKNSSAE